MLACALALAACKTGGTTRPVAANPSDELTPETILRAMTAVADWQLANPSEHPRHHWPQAAFYTGLTALADVSSSPKYAAAMREIARSIDHKPGPRPGHGDDHAVVQSFVWLYERDRDPAQLAPSRAALDAYAAAPHDEPLTWDEDVHNRQWAWCDALYMAPPSYAMMARITGDRHYFDVMNALWWKTTDYLYDPAEKLYFRDSRFFDQRERNGQKVFWSRGNGWVLGGLARVLQNLPADYPDRPRYETLFRDMASRIAGLQGQDGFWRSSLLDPQSKPMPESSGTGFHVYAIAWGVNQGLLSREPYAAVVEKGWRALTSAVAADGRLGYVQKIGYAPGATDATTTEAYGVGAFLLAGSELLKMTLVKSNTKVALVEAENPLETPRRDETIELPWQWVAARVPNADPARVAVIDDLSGAFLPVQRYGASEGAAPTRLLWQSHFLGRERRRFRVLLLSRPFAVPVEHPTFGRFVPERKDDVAWENDRGAYRMYGPALEAAGEISSGIDVWNKRVRRSVIDDWYASDDYHVDHGQGLDNYKVGASRGCGGLAFHSQGELSTSRNYVEGRFITRGPLRVEFELSYAPWGTPSVGESKRIRLDRGHLLSRIEERFTGDDRATRTVALGIVKRAGAGSHVFASPDGAYMTYWEPATGEDGHTACAVLWPKAGARHAEAPEHHLLLADARMDAPIVYHAGATWSKAKDAPTEASFRAEVDSLSRAITNPISVRMLEDRP